MISSADWAELEAFLLEIGVDKKFLLNSTPPLMGRFLGLLLEKNEFLNLTAIRDPQTAVWKHIADSLALLRMEPMGRLLDWGSGGGLPGIPVALARMGAGEAPNLAFLDSVGKKVRAIEEFGSTLGLGPSAQYLNLRGEDLLKDPGQKFDTAVLRAVAPAERAVTWLSPRIPRWIFLLGPQQLDGWLAEKKRIGQKGLELSEIFEYRLPRDQGERRILEIRKK
jgi:16S rRNA (guanine527-N7)-methyltransferase